MKKRFLISYLLSFAVLYGIGFWYTGRMVGAHWSRLPTDKIRKVNPFFESATVLFFQPGGGEPLQLIAADDDELNQVDGFVDGDERYIAMIWMSHELRFKAVAPLVYAKYSTVFPHGEIFTQGVIIPDADRDRAERLLYEKARTTFDMAYFRQSEITFPTPIDDISSARGTHVFDGFRFIIPPWFIPILFALVPFVIAWTITAATDKGKPNPT